MFSELIKLRELARLLRRRRYLEVLKLARDPSIREHRKAVVASERARKALLQEAVRLRESGDATQAFRNVTAILRDREDAGARRLETELLKVLGDRDLQRRALDAEVRQAAEMANRGNVSEAVARLEPLAAEHPRAAASLEDLKRSQEKARDLVKRVGKHLGRKDVAGAREALACLRAGNPDPGNLRAEDLRTPDLEDLHVRLLKLAAAGDDATSLGEVLIDCVSLKPAEDAPLARALAKAGKAHATLVRSALQKGLTEEAARALSIYPLGTGHDEEALRWARGLRLLDRARRMDAEGESQLAEQLSRDAEALLPPTPVLDAFLKEVAAREKEARRPLELAQKAMSSGRLIDARKALLDLLERQPAHRGGLDLLDSLDAQEKEDREVLSAARANLEAGGLPRLEAGRKALMGLAARRSDLDEIPVLLRDFEHRLRELKLRVLDEESRLLNPVNGHGSSAPTLRGDVARRPAGKRPVVFRSESRSSEGCLPGGESIDPAEPFVLRVEEQGDWLVHPGDSVLVGNATGGVADVPVMAAIGSRHARIERVEGRRGRFEYRIVPASDKKVLRNRRLLTGATVLRHGDVVQLGDNLTLTILFPVPDNATAVLELGGDFTSRDCRKVILFCEKGRQGSIVLGPGPEAHVALGVDRERVEVLRGDSGEASGTLLARSPKGVAVGNGSDRPQVRARPRVPIRAGGVGFFLDPVD